MDAAAVPRKSWEKIKDILAQAFPNTDRTVRECQKRYHTIAMNAKDNISRLNKDYSSTGKKVFHFNALAYTV